uniref:EOG090X0GPB n=1 Tax=Daphnia atkinsoni TaxID=342845 RepID=A0A4Y7LYA5_9CRUS|nr:EOG090X0GPB [Daphnia atkinsoni]
MDFSWLESTFHTSRPLKKEDCIVTFLHWMLLRNGFRVLHSKEGQLKIGDVEGKEILPELWNKDSVYELQYMKDGQLHMMKAVIVDGELALTIVRMKDEKVANLVLETDTVIGDGIQSFGEAFKDKVGLYNVIEKELMTSFIEKMAPSKPAESEPSTRRPRSPPPDEKPSRSSFPDPFAVGGGDLDPLGRGIGGGMLMDPRHIGGWRPQPGIPGNLPPGAVPPGARFDPFGPIGTPPVRQPRPRGRLHALQTGLSIKKDKEDLSFLLALMNWLEKTKQEMKSNETVSNEIVAQAHMENVAVKLFNWADTEDRHKHYNKNVVKAFYSAGMLFDVCSVFGELNEDVAQQKKYAKWRAAHLHNCLNSGETPSDSAPKPDDQLINDSENLEYGFSSDLKDSSGHSHVHDVVRPSISTPPKQATPPSSVPTYVQESSSVLVTPEQIVQAQKHCKYASSALTYEDVPTAIDNLQKALRVLQIRQRRSVTLYPGAVFSVLCSSSVKSCNFEQSVY